MCKKKKALELWGIEPHSCCIQSLHSTIWAKSLNNYIYYYKYYLRFYDIKSILSTIRMSVAIYIIMSFVGMDCMGRESSNISTTLQISQKG